VADLGWSLLEVNRLYPSGSRLISDLISRLNEAYPYYTLQTRNYGCRETL
jgi:hypothetical protein